MLRVTGVVSSPLEKLAFKVGKIQELGTDHLPSVSSPIREISVLSKAIDTLDAAVKSFSAFVPIGLVTQLLHSEQKLELAAKARVCGRIRRQRTTVGGDGTHAQGEEHDREREPGDVGGQRGHDLDRRRSHVGDGSHVSTLFGRDCPERGH